MQRFGYPWPKRKSKPWTVSLIYMVMGGGRVSGLDWPQLQVKTTELGVITSEGFALEEGLDKLKQVAGLPTILQGASVGDPRFPAPTLSR